MSRGDLPETRHKPVEHDYGPSWCRVCLTKWPCEFAPEETP